MLKLRAEISKTDFITPFRDRHLTQLAYVYSASYILILVHQQFLVKFSAEVCKHLIFGSEQD